MAEEEKQILVVPQPAVPVHVPTPVHEPTPMQVTTTVQVATPVQEPTPVQLSTPVVLPTSVNVPPKSTTFDGPIRLNDLLLRDVDEVTQFETVSVTSSASGDSSAAVPLAEPADVYFHEEKDVLKTPTDPIRFRGRSPLTKSQSTDMHLSDKDSASIGSADSGHHSKLQSLIHKAKVKGKKLVHRKTKKSESSNDVELTDEVTQVDMDREKEMVAARYGMVNADDAERPEIHPAVVQTAPAPQINRTGVRKIPFFKFRLSVAAFMLVATLYLPFFLTGFLWGVYLCTVAFMYAFVSKPIEVKPGKMSVEHVQKIVEEMDRQNTQEQGIVYKGWMNELRGRYDPGTYHPNQTRSVLVRLDGKYLRISRPKRNVIKYSYYEDPTINEPEPTMIGQSIYDLTNAEVNLRPKSLAPRRWWVRKYPIHIRLASRASVITNVNAEKNDRRASKISDIYSAIDESDSSAYEESDDEEYAKTITKERRSNSASENDLTRIVSDAVNSLPPKKKVAQGRSIYLFVRSHREKERWFHYLREACCKFRTIGPKVAVVPSEDVLGRRQSAQSLPEAAFIGDAEKISMNSEYFLYVSTSVQFSRYMAEVLRTTPEMQFVPPATGVVSMDLGTSKWKPRLPNSNSDVISAANALASRIFYDFCRDEFWVSRVRDKVQSKLGAISLPYFIETLELSKFELGPIAPAILGVHPPIVDDWGVWVDMEISYPGGLSLVLETKVNLMKLKADGKEEGPKRKASRSSGQSAHSHHYSDLDLPISPESSPDEDLEPYQGEGSAGKGKKILSFVDKVANSSIFQGATDFKPIKKMMEGISSTRLLLNVEVTALEGTLAINFAPPPSDRFWYGFRQPPKLTIKAVPQVGDRAVEFSAISEWIENRLRVLVEKNLVLPAMDDIIIPVMSGNEMFKFGYNK